MDRSYPIARLGEGQAVARCPLSMFPRGVKIICNAQFHGTGRLLPSFFYILSRRLFAVKMNLPLISKLLTGS